jgi:hypothetical protein
MATRHGSTLYRIRNLDANCYVRVTGRESFLDRQAKALATDLRRRGYRVRIEVDRASASALAVKPLDLLRG